MLKNLSLINSDTIHTVNTTSEKESPFVNTQLTLRSGSKTLRKKIMMEVIKEKRNSLTDLIHKIKLMISKER